MAAPTPVDMRAELKQLVDHVPNEELATAKRFLEYLAVVHSPTDAEQSEWDMWETASDEVWALIDADEREDA